MRGQPMDLHRLLYTSEADRAGAGGQPSDAVRRIAENARRSNEGKGLTGALLLVRDTFIQVLEGPLGPLEETFETICRDLRHRRMKLVEFAPTPQRLFGDWSMACLSQDNGEPTKLRLNRDLEEVYFTLNASPPAALRQMRDLLDGVRPSGERIAPARTAAG